YLTFTTLSSPYSLRSLPSFPTRRSSDLVTHGSADLDQNDFGPLSGFKNSRFNFVGNMRNDLNGSAKVIASTFLRYDGIVNLASRDRKSTRLNSSHEWISYAVFCLKKKYK